jgi:hypothetical protein
VHRPIDEPWLLDEPFHTYVCPLTFVPDVEWPGEVLSASNPDNPSTPSIEELDSNAEAINLPLGLLNSPPHQVGVTEEGSSLSIDLQKFCTTTAGNAPHSTYPSQRYSAIANTYLNPPSRHHHHFVTDHRQLVYFLTN